MKTYSVVVTKVINAPTAHVYRLVSDMNHHRNFLPKEFAKLEIVQGGIGAGTVTRAHMNAMGSMVVYTLTVTEPEPGRVMRETDEAAGVDTFWTFTPVDGGARCELHLETKFRPKPGFMGFLERLLTPAIRGVYRRELDLLDAYARKTPIAS